jgi:hypothetical protein
MLASLLARFHQPGEYEIDRYAGWTASLQKLRDDWASGVRAKPDELSRYLDDIPDEQRPDALQDLTAEHLRLAWREGRGPCLEEYPIEEVPSELMEDELLARYQLPHGDMPGLEEYLRRYNLRPDALALLARRFLDAGRYVKLRKIGLGAMGEVWDAYDSHLRRRVAIKQPRADLATPAEALRLFAAEARITAGLDHPGIVSVHEFRDGPEPFCVMRLVDGPTLGARIADFHRPPLERSEAEQRMLWHQLLFSFTSACEAVAYAHTRDVLHRDLKPANIVVGEHGVTAILDWGNDSIAGTPDYMAPEQADGIADARTDVFGLGAILYELLTGRSPHGWPEGSRPGNWREHVRAARFEPPRRIDPRAERALEAVCLRALNRDPAHRYQTAAELALEMARYLACEPVLAWQEPLHRRFIRMLLR